MTFWGKKYSKIYGYVRFLWWLAMLYVHVLKLFQSKQMTPTASQVTNFTIKCERGNIEHVAKSYHLLQ